MRIFFIPVLCIALLAACNNSGTSAVKIVDEMQDTLQEAAADAEVNVVKRSFPKLFDYLKNEDTTFSENRFSIAGESKMETVPPTPADEARLQPFKKYFIYNRDSSAAVDLYSYNYIITDRAGVSRLEEAGPDAEAGVINFKANTRKRIFFGGPSHALWDAKWINADELLLVGAESHNGGNLIPTIWHINLRDAFVEMYAYEGELQANISGYQAEKQDMGF